MSAIRSCVLPSITAVLRIHFILMRIRILDSHWKKMEPYPNPDLGHFFKIYWIFLTKNNYKILFFLAYFYPKTLWTIQKWWNFCNLSIFKSSDLSSGFKKFFEVFGWQFTPWIRIRGSAYFSGSGSKKPKSYGS